MRRISSIAVFAVACGGSSGDEADDGRPVLAEPTGGDPQGIPGQTSGGLPFPAGGALVSDDGSGAIDKRAEIHFATDRVDELVAFYDDFIEAYDAPQLTRSQPDRDTYVWQIFPDAGGWWTITLEAFAVADDGSTLVTKVTLVEV